MSKTKKSIFTNFVAMMITCFIAGVSLGPILKESYSFVLIGLVLCLVALFIVGFFQNKILNYIVSYTTVALLGIALFATIGFYAGELGSSIVAITIISVLFVFALCALFGWTTDKDLDSWGKILTIALIGFIVFSIVTLFVFPGHWIMALSGGFGVALFAGFTIYEMNEIRNSDYEEYEVPIAALSLFLNLYNMIVQALKAIYHLSQIFSD